MARILVVDDTPQNIALIELYLRGTEFEVVSVQSGLEAIEAAMQSAFDLILLDVVMPGVDGFETCRRLKNDPRTAFVPVIFLTGRMADESEKLAAYQLGAVDYITKPVDRDELVARIRVMLRLEEARSRLDRENVALRSQLELAEQRLAEVTRHLDELRELNQQQGGMPAVGLMLLGAGGRVEWADAPAVAALGELVAGQELAAAGPAAATLAAAVARGEAGGSLEVPAGDGVTRELRFVVRRFADDRVVIAVEDVTGVRRVERHMASRGLVAAGTRSGQATGYQMTDFVGRAPAVLELNERVGTLRQSRSTVLVYGESGTGKELVARALHFDGKNRSAPFLPLHCGAIAPELIESELFGHVKGAFTGAQQAHDGMFQAADGGTIFLDEIAETSLSVQVKLLRVLQRGEIRPVGANQPRLVDVRIIAATNRDLLELVREGRFREDLYYRLEVVTLQLPPLRERLEDVPMLVEHFLHAANRRHDRLDRPVRGVSKGAMERMLCYSWPGNVRELENVIEGAFALGCGEVLHEENLPQRVLNGAPRLSPSPVHRVRAPSSGTPLPAQLPPGDMRAHREAAEREAIQIALEQTVGDKVAAAQQLGMSRSTFYRRLKELGL